MGHFAKSGTVKYAKVSLSYSKKGGKKGGLSEAELAKKEEEEALADMKKSEQEVQAEREAEEKARLAELKVKTAPALSAEDQARLKAVLARKNVTLDHEKHQIAIPDHLEFHLIKHGDDTTASFKDESKCMAKL